jgi:hypothetical protein
MATETAIKMPTFRSPLKTEGLVAVSPFCCSADVWELIGNTFYGTLPNESEEKVTFLKLLLLLDQE